jgi:hypothetical protein
VDASRVYPNAVIEMAWGVRATTRDWATVEKVGRLVAAAGDASGAKR